jgi:hypothetical protein
LEKEVEMTTLQSYRRRHEAAFASIRRSSARHAIVKKALPFLTLLTAWLAAIVYVWFMTDSL